MDEISNTDTTGGGGIRKYSLLVLRLIMLGNLLYAIGLERSLCGMSIIDITTVLPGFVTVVLLLAYMWRVITGLAGDFFASCQGMGSGSSSHANVAMAVSLVLIWGWLQDETRSAVMFSSHLKIVLVCIVPLLAIVEFMIYGGSASPRKESTFVALVMPLVFYACCHIGAAAVSVMGEDGIIHHYWHTFSDFRDPVGIFDYTKLGIDSDFKDGVLIMNILVSLGYMLVLLFGTSAIQTARHCIYKLCVCSSRQNAPTPVSIQIV